MYEQREFVGVTSEIQVAQTQDGHLYLSTNVTMLKRNLTSQNQ